MELKDDLANFFLEVTALLHGHGIWLFGERLADFGEVAVVIVLVAHLFNSILFSNFAIARSVVHSERMCG